MLLTGDVVVDADADVSSEKLSAGKLVLPALSSVLSDLFFLVFPAREKSA
jgi:hypothetical protein